MARGWQVCLFGDLAIDVFVAFYKAEWHYIIRRYIYLL